MPASNSFSWFSNVNQPFSLLDFTSLASSFISCSVACLFLKSCILGITCLLCLFRFNVRHRIQRLSEIIIKHYLIFQTTVTVSVTSISSASISISYPGLPVVFSALANAKFCIGFETKLISPQE